MHADTTQHESQVPAAPIAPEMLTASRRGAMRMAIAAPLAMTAAAGASSAESALGSIIQGAERQAAAFMAGDMKRWLDLTRPTDDFTLMQPFGGPASHGFDSSPERLARLARAFRNGDARLEVAHSFVSDDLVVLVMIERQRGEVHGLPDQDWSLRVTQVHRRHGSEWRLAHRHADPLVHPIGIEKAASLARGD